MKAIQALLVVAGLQATISETKAAQYQVSLSDKNGTAIAIGQADINHSHVYFERDDRVFKDFFLSMKEMKCLEGPEIWCHIAYPYPMQGINADNQLHWLSHNLLFMYKKHDQFGAQLWQGVYFALEQGNKGFTATAYSVDLNELASPPADLSTPPIAVTELELLDIDSRWLPHLSLDPVVP